MRRETQLAAQDCNDCYYTNRLLAIKINIVLEININSSSSADREEGTNYFKTLSEFHQLKYKLFILILADQPYCNSRNPERKREKTFTWQWKNNKEKERL